MSLTKRRCTAREGVTARKGVRGGGGGEGGDGSGGGGEEREEEKEEKAAADVSGTREGGGIRARGYSWTPQNIVLAAASAVA